MLSVACRRSPGAPARGHARGRHAGTRSARRRRARGAARSGTMTSAGADGAGRERGAAAAAGPAPTRLAAEAVGLVRLVLNVEQPGARTSSSDRARRSTPPRADARRTRRPGARSRASRRRRSRRGAGRAARTRCARRWPAAAGSSVSMVIIASRDAHRADRPEARGAVDLGEAQAQQRGDDRQPEARIARPGAPQRDAQGLVLLHVAAQLLAVARDEQQGVVGPRAEHQHGQDPADWPLIRHPGLGQQVADPPRGRLGEEHGENGMSQKIGQR